MRINIKSYIEYAYAIYLFFLPLIIIPTTSEIFEFNKLVFTYLAVSFVSALWLVRMIIERKFIFSRTIIDIPLVIFLFAMLISTFFSIDLYTSVFGYYSRFNGGLLSLLSYSLLYWAFVSNVDKKATMRLINVTVVSAILVGIYGILQKLGIDKNIWVQDVKNRVFSTLGQPNWLAAYMLIMISLLWIKILRKNHINILEILIYTLFSVVLLFTKSRSGIIGFAFSLASLVTLMANIGKRKYFKQLSIFIIIPILLALVIGTPWNPPLVKLIKSEEVAAESETQNALEIGGTESGDIRKIVWQGALDIWKNNKLTGSGLETFAFSYYTYRPMSHNTVSEWDYLYNKAHNEYLNYLATTGLIGFIAYIGLLIAQSILILKPHDGGKYSENIFGISLFSGLIGVLVSNFFGFSVVATSVLTFLIPGLVVTSYKPTVKNFSDKPKLSDFVFSFVVVIVLSFIISKILMYWYADTLYSKGRNLNTQSDFTNASESLIKSISLQPNQAIYYNELAKSYYEIAGIVGTEDQEIYNQLKNSSIEQSEKAIELSPFNMNIRRNNASMYLALAEVEPALLAEAANSISKSIELAPTDAKLYYNLGLIFAKTENFEEATKTLALTIEMKPNYRDARLALGLVYEKLGEDELARKQYEYILTNIDPTDKQTQRQKDALSQ